MSQDGRIRQVADGRRHAYSVSSVVLRDTSCYDMLKESNPELVCGEAGDEGRDI